MESRFIDSVKSTCKGYYSPNKISAVNEANSINEFLHFMHSYIVNNNKILRSLQLISEMKNDYEYSISLRGNRNPIFEQLFVMFPSSLDYGITDMVIIDDKKLLPRLLRGIYHSNFGHNIMKRIKEENRNYISGYYIQDKYLKELTS